MEKEKVICIAILVILLGTATISPLLLSTAEAQDGKNMVFDMQVLSWDTISVDAGTAIAAQLAEIGISFTVSITDDAVMYPNLYQIPRNYKMYEMSHGYGGYPDHVWWRMHSCNDIDWGDNCYGLHNDTMDAALDALLHATNDTARKEAAAEVQNLSLELVPYIPLFLSDDTHAIRNEWENYTFVPGGIFTSMNRLTMLNIYSTDANDTFVMAYPSDIGEMNPLFSRSERTGWYLIQVYDSLIAYDTEMNPIPWLADSWDISEDAKNFTFHIREGMKWHDGVPLNASDVAFTLEYYKAAPEDALSWSLLQKMEECTVHDEYTVSAVFNESLGFGLTQIGEINIVPKHIRDWGDWEHGNSQHAACWDDAGNATAHTGSGPFKFVERTAEAYILLEKNPYWWGKEPNVDGIRILVVSGQSARILAMRQGTVDTERYELMGAADIKAVTDAPELKVITEERPIPSQWDYVLGFNLTIPGLDDPIVREAICYALNRTEIIEVARGGHGTATWTTIPEAFFPAYYSEDGRFPAQNITYANQILNETGYLDTDGDWIRNFPAAPPPPPTAPEIDLISPHHATYDIDATIVLKFDIDKATSWIGYSLDGATNTTITGDITLSPLGLGLHNIIVYANDTDGNMGASDRVYFTIAEEAPPVIALASPRNKTYTEKSIPLELIISETPSWIGYSLDGATNTTMTGTTTTLTDLTLGSHNIIVYANDTAGLMGASDKMYFTIEEAPPPEIDWILIAAVAIICIVVGVAAGYFIVKRKK